MAGGVASALGLGAGAVVGAHDFRAISLLTVFPLVAALIPFAAEMLVVMLLSSVADRAGGRVGSAIVLMVVMGIGAALYAHWAITSCVTVGGSGAAGCAPGVAYPAAEPGRTELVAGLAWASQAGLMAAFLGADDDNLGASWLGSCVAVAFLLIVGGGLGRLLG